MQGPRLRREPRWPVHARGSVVRTWRVSPQAEAFVQKMHVVGICIEKEKIVTQQNE